MKNSPHKEVNRLKTEWLSSIDVGSTRGPCGVPVYAAQAQLKDRLIIVRGCGIGLVRLWRATRSNAELRSALKSD